MQILRLTQLEIKTGLKRSSIYDRMMNGDFPRPIRLGGRAVGWSEEQVDSWLMRQARLTHDSTPTSR